MERKSKLGKLDMAEEAFRLAIKDAKSLEELFGNIEIMKFAILFGFTKMIKNGNKTRKN